MESWADPTPEVLSFLTPSSPKAWVKVYRSRIVWVVVLVAIFAPLGVLRYRSMSR